MCESQKSVAHSSAKGPSHSWALRLHGKANIERSNALGPLKGNPYSNQNSHLYGRI